MVGDEVCAVRYDLATTRCAMCLTIALMVIGSYIYIRIKKNSFILRGLVVKKRLLVAAVALSMMAQVTPVAAKSSSFSGQQKTDIEKIVHNYLVEHPEVLLEASKALQKKQQQVMKQQAEGAIAQNAAALFNSDSPVTGNAKGDITLVEFFDYQCVHCKHMAPVIKELVNNNKDLRVVYKDFPIFGKGSDFAARAALAAAMQGKYMELHNALIDKKQRLSPSIILQAADSVGINTTKLKADMKSDKISAMVKANMQLAEKLRLMGTPAFVVAKTPNGEFKAGGKTYFLPGAASAEALQGVITELR